MPLYNTLEVDILQNESRLEWIEEPIDIELKINNEKIIAISKERFDTNNEYKFKIELPMNISDSLVIAASINEATEIANWNIGRLFR